MSIDARATAALREDFRGELIGPQDPRYDKARVVWNGMIDRRPALVARCTSSGDVASAVRFAREQDLVVAVRSGGHSVGGFSTCDGGVLIDLAGMRGVIVDPDRRTATVGGGSLLRELDHEAQTFGLACPVGNVSHTGVAGLTLGGGMGRLQRKHGFTIDNLLSVELVTADGDLIRAGEDDNEDLFWGLRGAGANFGVVTSFEFRLHPVGPTITQGWEAYPSDRALEVVDRFRGAPRAPDALMLTLLFRTVSEEDPWPDLIGRPVVLIGAIHSGPVEHAERDLAPFRLGKPLGGSFEPKSYLSVQAMGDETLAWGKRFYMKGGYCNDISEDLVEVVLERIAAAPGACEIGFWAQGGAITRVPEDATAFTGREAAFWIGVESFWEDPAEDAAFIDWGRATWNAVTPFTAAGHYVNDMIETGEGVVRSIYGAAKYERLLGLKRTYDPDNVFRLNQNIAPS